VPAQLVSIGEGGLSALLPFQLTGNQPIELRSRLFEEIGIGKPIFRVLTSEADDQTAGVYETRFSFVGMAEEDLRRIRAWIQKELIRRRK